MKLYYKVTGLHRICNYTYSLQTEDIKSSVRLHMVLFFSGIKNQKFLNPLQHPKFAGILKG